MDRPPYVPLLGVQPADPPQLVPPRELRPGGLGHREEVAAVRLAQFVGPDPPDSMSRSAANCRIVSSNR